MERNVLKGVTTLHVDENGRETVEIELDRIQELNELVGTLNGLETMDAVSGVGEAPNDDEIRREMQVQFLQFYRTVCLIAHGVRRLCPQEWIYGMKPESGLGV